MQHYTLETLITLVEDLPVGTNKAMLHFMWMLSGALLPHRGALHPALKSIGLDDKACRRAWTAFGYGAWTIRVIKEMARARDRVRQRRTMKDTPITVDLVAFWRPR